jgi:hypothetical protein
MISVGFNCYGENDNLMIERYKYLYRSYISIHHFLIKTTCQKRKSSLAVSYMVYPPCFLFSSVILS